MDREQKIELLKDACNKYEHNCTTCPYNGNNDFWCHTFFYAEELLDEDLDKAVDTVRKTKTKSKPREDIVNHPNHYTTGGMECIDEMILVFGKEAVRYFCLCNAWKYRRRCLYKNGEEDMQKSHWYMQKYKELSEEGLYEEYC